MRHYAIIILAAGASSRFGYPKQLVRYQNESLIRHALSVATKTAHNIFVVIGANAALMEKEIEDFTAHKVLNKNWEEGMSSSIRCGLNEALKENAKLDAVIVMLCDQPYVDAAVLKQLIAKHEETNKPIVACAYKDTIGTPVLFYKKIFPALLVLKGQSGAKKIIAENMDATATIPFELGYIDIDTKEDYASLQKNPFND